MSIRGLQKHKIRQPAAWSRSRRLVKIGFCLGVGLLAVMALAFLFANAILNGFARGKVERAFTKAHPGYALRIGQLSYSVSSNRMVAQSISLSSTNQTLRTGPVSLTGVRWARLFWGTPVLAKAFAHASLEATNLEAQFPRALYGIRCSKLRASVPDSQLLGEGAELWALGGDEEFFAAHSFQTTRFHLLLPECRVSGLAYGDLFQEKAYRASAVQLSRPSLDVLVNRDKPPEPFVKPPPTLQEALAAIQRPLRIDRLRIINGSLSYGERVIAGAAPGVLTFGAVNISAKGISNHGERSGPLQVRAQSEFMNAGTLKVLMNIPPIGTNLSFHYSGSLGQMDLTRLNAFLEVAENLRIKSGSAEAVTFDIQVTEGQARGHVRGLYRDLEIALLDKQTGSDQGLKNRVVSFLANALKIRNSNAPDASGLIRDGEVDYLKKPEDEFLQFMWFALRSGILDAISH